MAPFLGLPPANLGIATKDHGPTKAAMFVSGLCAVVGFHAPSTSIAPTSTNVLRASRCSAPILAEPQIEWQDASVVSNEQLARGTMQLRIRASTPHSYRAGHILGSWLPIEPGTTDLQVG